MPAIRPASTSDRDALRDLLHAAKLPVADLDSSPIDFLAAEDNGRLVGAVGLQAIAQTGLLRSLVVSPGVRGTGIGDALVEAMERHAQNRGVERLVLLTNTAAEFFARRGYVATDRAAMPDAIKATAEFQSLCPSSATCLSKVLTP